MSLRKIELGGKRIEGLQPHPPAISTNTRAKKLRADRVDIGPRLP